MMEDVKMIALLLCGLLLVFVISVVSIAVPLIWIGVATNVAATLAVFAALVLLIAFILSL